MKKLFGLALLVILIAAGVFLYRRNQQRSEAALAFSPPPPIPHSLEIDDPNFQVFGHDIISVKDQMVLVGSISRRDPPIGADLASIHYNPLFTDYSSSIGWIRVLEPDGKIAWERFYEGAQDIFPKTLVPFEDGFVLVGEQRKGKRRAYTGWILRVDSQGKELWRRSLGKAGSTGLNAVSVSPSGAIVAAGSQQQEGDSHGWALAIDAKGTVLWEKSLPQVHDISSVISLGQSLILGGIADLDTRGLSTSRLIALSADGEIQWDKKIPEQGKGEVSALLPLKNGGWAVGKGQSEGDPRQGAWIVRFRGDGEIEYSKILPGKDNDMAQDAAPLENGDILLVGSRMELAEDKRFLRLWRVAPDGRVVWERTESISGDDHPFGIAMDSLGSLWIVGQQSTTDRKSIRLLTLKVDGNGNLKWGSSRFPNDRLLKNTKPRRH